MEDVSILLEKYYLYTLKINKCLEDMKVDDLNSYLIDRDSIIAQIKKRVSDSKNDNIKNHREIYNKIKVVEIANERKIEELKIRKRKLIKELQKNKQHITKYMNQL